MFSLLTSSYLWLGLGAALVPVLIHLIYRNKPEIVHFAAMRFLELAPLKMLRYQKLKHWLLLLMRVLALLLLGLAFARPYFAGHKVPALFGGEPRALAIIVDASASMMAANHLAAAREEAGKILQQAASGDRVWLINAANTMELLAEEVAPVKAVTALPQLTQKLTAGNLRETLLFADQLLSRARLQRRVIYLISDLQASNMPAGTLPLNSNAEFIPVPIQPAWQNVAVLDGQIVKTSGNKPASGELLEATYACRVRNFSDNEQQITVQLLNNGASVGAKNLTLTARTEQVVQFSVKASGRDQNYYFEVKAPVDDLPADNRFYLVAPTERKRRLLVLNGNAEAAYFVREAMRLPGSPYQLFEATPNALPQYRLEDFDVVLVVGVAGFNRGEATALQQYVQSGGGLIFTLATTLQSEMYNRLLSEILPGQITVPIRPNESEKRRGAALTEIDFGHPIFKVFVDPANGDPTTIRALQYYRVEANPATNRLAGFEDGAAALLERSAGKGKVLLWTSSLDLPGGNLPVRGIFVPLLYQWLNYVCRPEPPPATTVVGQTLFFDETIQAGQSVLVTLPDGTPQTLEKSTAPVLKETSQAGFYRVQQNQRVLWQAVNFDAHESDPASLPVENFAARLIRPDDQAQAQNSVTGIFDPPEATAREAEKQQKLWRFGLWALLILLLGEVGLANKTPR